MYGHAIDFLAECKASGTDIHSFRLICDGKETLDLTLPPYKKDDRIQLYSLSKSFTSFAFGTLVDAGLASPDGKVLDFFPEYADCVTDERVKNITFKNLLSMSSGHASCMMDKIYIDNSDPLRLFFSAPLVRDPGTSFVYSTSATFVVAAAVEKITGRKMTDYLDEKLFAPLGLPPVKWDTICGMCTGGVGLYLSSEDVCRFAKLLYGRGVYEGKRLISEEYLNDATSWHISNGDNGSPDWCAGYGFQFWRNYGGGFRGDGAYGQLCVVLPEKKVAFTVLGEAANMQEELNIARRFAEKALEPDDDRDENDLIEAMNAFYAPARSDEEISLDGTYKNGIYGTVAVKCDSEALTISFGNEKLVAGRGKYVYSEPLLHRAVPVIWQLPDDEWRRLRVRSTFDVVDGKVNVVARSVDTPHTIRIVLNVNETELKVEFSSRFGNIDESSRSIIGVRG